MPKVVDKGFKFYIEWNIMVNKTTRRFDLYRGQKKLYIQRKMKKNLYGSEFEVKFRIELAHMTISKKIFTLIKRIKTMKVYEKYY